jgi:hypothetical protein
MHRFPIGTQFAVRRGPKRTDICTVTDHLTTTNSRGEVVRERYMATHPFCGQTITDDDVVDPTIARGLLPDYQHLLALSNPPR